MSIEPLEISSEPAATPADTDVVRNGVYQFNFDATGIVEYHDVALFVRDETGAIKGGLLGYVWAGWLHVTDLWLQEEYRRRGLGGQLLVRAEQEAISFGARGAFLSSFDFQAPEFYRRHGYEVRAVFPDYPPGHTEYHLWKVFRSDP